MNKPRLSLVVGLVVVVALAAGAVWWFQRPKPPATLTLYGNVDLRQVSLAFNANERVAQMRASEGDHVARGEVLAVLDTVSLKLRIARAEAQTSAQEQVLQRLKAGSRAEEIAQSRGSVAAAQAEAAKADDQYERLRSINQNTGGRGISRQDLDAARAARAVAQAQLENARKAMQLVVAGPRKEDIEQARAQLEVARADVAVVKQQLADSELRAPVDAVVRSRLLEPGDMASPQRPAYALAIIDPKWVRAYVAEPDLGRIKAGQGAQVHIDSAPQQPLNGRIGYISSVAEFTPKTVQTEDLRTSLVYEVRINVDDPGDRLRLGMPATITLADEGAPQATGR